MGGGYSRERVEKATVSSSSSTGDAGEDMSANYRRRKSSVTSANCVRCGVLAVPTIPSQPYADYRFVKKIGEGAFSSVYKASALHDRGKFAIKEVNLSKLNKQQTADLENEMIILSQLRHPSIVRVHKVYTLPDKVFLVMDYLRGGELLNAICKRERYSEDDARSIMHQVTSALEYLHARRVIHRDIKPENLILETRSLQSRVLLVDFGFATILTDESDGKKSKYLCGTPGYMAPEVMTDRIYSTAGDMWSLGVIMYILLSGTMPFDSKNDFKIKNGIFQFPRSRWRNVSESAKDLIMRMLVVDRSARITALDALNSVWMNITPMESYLEAATVEQRNNDISDNLNQMRKLNAARRFRRSILLVKTALMLKKGGEKFRRRRNTEEASNIANAVQRLGEISDQNRLHSSSMDYPRSKLFENDSDCEEGREPRNNDDNDSDDGEGEGEERDSESSFDLSISSMVASSPNALGMPCFVSSSSLPVVSEEEDDGRKSLECNAVSQSERSYPVFRQRSKSTPHVETPVAANGPGAHAHHNRYEGDSDDEKEDAEEEAMQKSGRSRSPLNDDDDDDDDDDSDIEEERNVMENAKPSYDSLHPQGCATIVSKHSIGSSNGGKIPSPHISIHSNNSERSRTLSSDAIENSPKSVTRNLPML